MGGDIPKRGANKRQGDNLLGVRGNLRLFPVGFIQLRRFGKFTRMSGRLLVRGGPSSPGKEGRQATEGRGQKNLAPNKKTANQRRGHPPLAKQCPRNQERQAPSSVPGARPGDPPQSAAKKEEPAKHQRPHKNVNPQLVPPARPGAGPSRRPTPESKGKKNRSRGGYFSRLLRKKFG